MQGSNSFAWQVVTSKFLLDKFFGFMVHIIKHPLVQNELTILRGVSTSSPDFRESLRRISVYLIYEVLQKIGAEWRDIKTPLGNANGLVISSVTFIAVLRASIPMLEAALNILPHANAGFIGIRRDEKTLKPEVYYINLPLNLGEIYILDPMIATAGTIVKTIEILGKRGEKLRGIISVISSRDAVKILGDRFPSIELVTAAVDEELNLEGYIVPGLGDCGDRYYGS